jgi:hypothetical protein
MVHCELDSGSTKYEHSSLEWLDERPFISQTTTGDNISCSLVASIVAKFGNTFVYMLTLDSVLDVPPAYEVTKPWELGTLTSADEHNTVYSLPLAGVGTSSHLTFSWYEHGYSNIRCLPGIVYLSGANKDPILLSRAILWNTFSQFRNKPRNLATYQSINRYVTAQYAVCLNLPAENRYRAELATVVLVMTQAVVLETSVMIDMNQNFSRLWGVHAGLVSLEPARSFSSTDLAVAGLWTSLSALTIKPVANWLGTIPIVVPKTGMNIACAKVAMATSFKAAVVASAPVVAASSMPVVLPVWAAVTTVVAAAYFVNKHDLLGNHHRRETIKQWAATIPGDVPAPIPPGVYPLEVAPKFGPSDRVKPAKEQGHGQLSLPPVLPTKSNFPKLELRGAAFSDTIPTYFASTAENEYTALANRMTVTVEVDAEAWRFAGKLFRSTGFIKYMAQYYRDHPIHVNRGSAEQYANKFPREMQLSLIEGYEKYQQQGKLISEDFKTAGFIKVEKAIKIIFGWEFIVYEICEDGTPRIIISMRPTLSVVFGACMQQFARNKKKAGADYTSDVEEPPICPKGVSAERRASWMSHYVEKFGGEANCVFYDHDMEHYDGSYSKQAFEEGFACSLDLCVVTPAGLAAQLKSSHDSTRGKTHGGVRYSLKNKMASGSSDTSDLGTTVNEIGSCYALTTVENDQPEGYVDLGRNFAIAAEGDDGGGVIRKSWLTSTHGNGPGLEANMVRRWQKLGFKCKPHVRDHMYQVDFLSKLWYPCEGTYILGGEIGRVLSRTGWFINIKDEMTVRSAALSSLQDNHHVPFLCEYFTRIVELTKGQKLGGKIQEHSVHTERAHTYGPETMSFVTARYGLTDQDLAEFKSMLAKIYSLPVVISWPHYERCVAIDS